MSLKKALEYIEKEKNTSYYTEGTIDIDKAERACEIAVEDNNIESIFDKILSFYVPDGNSEVFKQKIEQYKSELLSF